MTAEQAEVYRAALPLVEMSALGAALQEGVGSWPEELRAAELPGGEAAPGWEARRARARAATSPFIAGAAGVMVAAGGAAMAKQPARRAGGDLLAGRRGAAVRVVEGWWRHTGPNGVGGAERTATDVSDDDWRQLWRAAATFGGRVPDQELPAGAAGRKEWLQRAADRARVELGARGTFWLIQATI